MPVDLRGYQMQAVEKVRESYRNRKTAPLLQLPTGGGKTRIASFIMDSAASRGHSVCFMVHRVELIRQTSNTLTECGIPHGVIHRQYPVTRHKVQVASVQTLARRLDRYPHFDIIILDECHHAVAGTWRKLLEHYNTAALLGLTATPSRLDGRGLGLHCGGFFDDLICGPSMRELIEGGFLARPRIFASPRHLDFSDLRMRGGEFEHHDAENLMTQTAIVGDAVDHYKKHLMGKRAIAFCTSIKHANAVSQKMEAAGIVSRRIDGTMTDMERRMMVRSFVEGRIKVITSCELISEGFDVPACDGAMLLRPTQSESLYLQQVGRALRAYPGKDSAIILDHAGNVARHGLPDDARVWTLDGRNRSGSEVTTQTCPSCYAVLPAYTAQCPECECALRASAQVDATVGTRQEGEGVTEVDGQLVELTAEDIEEMRRRRRNEVSAARTREELERIARQRGYRRGWVENILRVRQQRTAA